MQTILGAGGAIGTELAKALPEYTSKIRLVSRNPEPVNQDDELFSADLTNPEQTKKAVDGSEVAYLTVGLPYRTDVWKSKWPVIMENVIAACNKHNTKLVFFDNVYMYDPDHLNAMTEDTPVNPCSEKGKVRADIASKLVSAVENDEIEALIARCADYYGPGITDTSILTETVFKPLANGSKANWISSAEYKHSFTYTPDAGKATVLLGNTPEAYNQVWHLPTSSNPPTGKQWVEMIAKELDVDPKYRTAPKFILWLMGIFSSELSETVEMMYQYDRDYVFDSSKFEKHFDFAPTSYEKGIKEIVEKDYK